MDAQKVREITVRVLLVVFIVAALLIDFAAEPKSVWAKLQTPVMLLGIGLIIELLVPIGSKVSTIASGVEAPRMQSYHDGIQFYEALTSALREAKTEVDLTHIRREVPADFQSVADDWFEGILTWVNRDQRRSVRRVIASTDDKTREWAHDLRRRVAGTKFYIAITPWPLNVPAVNVAILDKRRVFMAMPGAVPVRSVGFETDDQDTVQQFCVAFEALWGSSTKLDSLPPDAGATAALVNSESTSTAAKAASA